MTDTLAVQASAVQFAYGERQALRGVDFEVQKGAAFGFLGPNGSGKSTLFKLLSTLVPLQQGAVTMLGHDLGREAAAIRRRVGVVFQSPAVDKKLTVQENLRYGGLMLGLGGGVIAGAMIINMAAAAAAMSSTSPMRDSLSPTRRRSS